MGLNTYNKKRDFKNTPEPSGIPAAKAKKPTGKKTKTSANRSPGKNPIFVIQKHQASHLHYDFRLEADGVLKSWAIPKEPVTDPTVKRLAVEVEDHPLDYASFEGSIPKGNYGAGKVEIWDSGDYTPAEPLTAAIEKGKVDFVLNGKRLKGAFSLVRMRTGSSKPQWLFSMKPTSTPVPTADSLHLKIDGRLLHLTHIQKVLYPSTGYSKKNVINYYRKIAPVLLPHLKGRPITLKRYPDGVDGKSFYEKHSPDFRPEWLHTIMMKGIQFVGIDSLSSLLWIANLASLELHPYLGKIPSLDCPDSVVFDLDPGEGVGLKECVSVALKLKTYLTQLGLKSLPKTSGSKGIQVYVPLNSKVTFEETKDFAKSVAVRLARKFPKEIVWEMPKALRSGKVMIDWSQNDANKTTVSVYSLRATPTPCVSTPLKWTELSQATSDARVEMLRFSPEQVLARVEKWGDLFENHLTWVQTLPRHKT